MVQKTDNKNAKNAKSADRIQDGLREAGRRAAELAQNPLARSLLAAFLVTAGTALAANKNVRDTARKTARSAQNAAEAAADAAAESANRVGAAMINAATEAVRRMMGDLDEAQSAGATPSASPRKASAKKGKGAKAKKSGKATAKSAAKPAAAKSTAKPAATKSARPAAKGSTTRKPAARKPGAAQPKAS